MASLDDITLLARAGFSRDEILAMVSPAQPAPSASVETTPVQTAPVAPVAQAAPVAPAETVAPVAPVETVAPVQSAPASQDQAQTIQAEAQKPVTKEDMTALLQAFNLSNVRVDIPPAFNLQDSLANRLTGLLTGKE